MPISLGASDASSRSAEYPEKYSASRAGSSSKNAHDEASQEGLGRVAVQGNVLVAPATRDQIRLCVGRCGPCAADWAPSAEKDGSLDASAAIAATHHRRSGAADRVRIVRSFGGRLPQ